MSAAITRPGGARSLIANAAQLSIRDLRLRPLRPVVQEPSPTSFDSPLEQALKRYVDSLPQP